MSQPSTLSTGKQLTLALIRIAVGWHFLYEAFVKLQDPSWTAAGYLASSTGPFAGIFRWLASDASLLKVIDRLNAWGLCLIGLALILGLLSRASAAAGMALLALYYCAHPPLFDITGGVTEGSYLVVNKNLVELLALLVVVAFPAPFFGLDGLFAGRKRAPADEAPAAKPGTLAPAYLGPIPRRQLIAALAGVPVLGAFGLAVLRKHGWSSLDALPLRAKRDPRDTWVASATVKTFRFSTAAELKGRLPFGKIHDLRLSRMILGGNLIGGWAHARDLIYVDKLVRAYHHQEKIFETFALAESCGVNAVLTNPALCTTIVNYWRRGGKIKFISDCGDEDLLEAIRKSIDNGASACYIQGGIADRLVERGQLDLMAEALDLIRKNGIPAGIGAHKLQTVKASVERGLKPDFWMKTMHHINYWSASTRPEQDNIWCDNPAETIAYMKDLREPWIAFKTLAAGAIEPKVGFRYAFESGADFICVGMYDFQIVDDVNLAVDALHSRLARRREWCA